MNAIIETIKTSRSICAYTERPAERELIAQALEAATYAPSTCHRHWWRATALTNRATIERFTPAVKTVNARKGLTMRKGWRLGLAPRSSC